MRVFITFIVIILLLGCTNDVRQVVLTPVRKVSIDVPAHFPLFSYCFKCHPTTEDICYYLDRDRNIIYELDIVKEAITHTVSIPKEGPNSIGKIYGFSILDDVFYYVDGNTPSVYRADKFEEATALRQISFQINTATYNSTKTNVSSFARDDLYHFENARLHPQKLYRMGNKIDASLLNNVPIGVLIDKNDSVYLSQQYYNADVFADHECRTYGVVSCQGPQDQIVHSWWSSPYLSVAMPGVKETQVLKVQKSEYDRFEYIDGLDPMNTYVKNGRYSNIYYDKYRKLYYRVYIIPNPDATVRSHLELQYTNDFSIMVYDRDFALMGEIKLNGRTQYVGTMMEIIPEGIIISTSNPNNPEYDESKIAFEILEVRID